eukprot:1178888-Prorocentrum_minimum.AAC.2
MELLEKTRSPPHGLIRRSALCSEENSGPGIRLRNFFVERGCGKVGRAGLFLALSVDGFQDPADCSTAFLVMNYTRCWAHRWPRGGDTASAVCTQRHGCCRCRWASIRSFGADIMGPCGWVSSARPQGWTSKNQRWPTSIPEMD